MSEQEQYKFTYIKEKTEKGNPMTSQKYINTTDFRLLRDWINQEGKQIQPPDPNSNNLKTEEQKLYKFTYIKEKTEKGNPMTSQKYINTTDFRLLRDWINQEGKQIQPPTLPTEEVSLPSDDTETSGEIKKLLEKVKEALTEIDEGSFDLVKFKDSLPDLLNGVISDNVDLKALLADDKEFKEELEAMMQGLENNPFKSDEKKSNITQAIEAIIDEFRTIVSKIDASEVPSDAQPDAQPGAPSGAQSDVKPPLGPEVPSGDQPGAEVPFGDDELVSELLDLLDKEPDPTVIYRYLFATTEELQLAIAKIRERLQEDKERLTRFNFMVEQQFTPENIHKELKSKLEKTNAGSTSSTQEIKLILQERADLQEELESITDEKRKQQINANILELTHKLDQLNRMEAERLLAANILQNKLAKKEAYARAERERSKQQHIAEEESAKIDSELEKSKKDAASINEQIKKQTLETENELISDAIKGLESASDEQMTSQQGINNRQLEQLKTEFFSGKELLTEMGAVEKGKVGKSQWNTLKSNENLQKPSMAVLYKEETPEVVTQFGGDSSTSLGIINSINNEIKDILKQTKQTLDEDYIINKHNNGDDEERYKKTSGSELNYEEYIDYLFTKINQIAKKTKGKSIEDINASIEICDKLKDKYNDIVQDYMKNISLPFAFKKMMNVFIFYIIKFNQFQNSYFIKKLQNLINSSKYNDSTKRGSIDESFRTIIGNSSIKIFLEKYTNLSTSQSLVPIVTLLTTLSTDYNEQDLQDYPELNSGIKSIITDIQNITNSSKNTIDDLNNIIFKYVSTRFKDIITAFNSADATKNYKDLSHYQFDIKLIGIFYFAIINLSSYFTEAYYYIERLKAEKYSSLFDLYSDSSVISYIKIRDGQNEEEEKYQLFNPRYIYFTDRPDKQGEDKSLGIKENGPSPTLSLLYCNNPNNRIFIPPSENNIVFDNLSNLSEIDNNEQALESLILDIDETDGSNKYKPIKYDHLLHYGHFNKVLYNVDNQTFGDNMKEIKDNLTDNKDVFVIGYGASGAGKTSTLIYDKTAIKKGKKDKSDGAIVFTLNQLAENNTKFQQLELTITELFMDDPTGDDKQITPKAFEKIKDVSFNYEDKDKEGISAFRASFNFASYISNLTGTEGKENLLLDETNFTGEDNTTFTLSEILQLLIDKKRKVFATTNNTQSSRSHVLVTIKFTIDKKPVFLYIGDFAGVENKFDYAFKYAYPKSFKDLINEIFSNMQDLTDNFPNKVKLINQILNANHDEQVKLLTNTRIINSLLEIVFKKGLISDTIWNFSDLKHAEEKWVEEYNKEEESKSQEELLSEEKENFIEKGHNYFYQTAKPDKFINDEHYIKMIAEMEKMIQFLVSKSGYDEMKIYNNSYVKTISSEPNRFEPSVSETQQMKELREEIKALTQEQVGIQGQIKQIELEAGLGNYINAIDEENSTASSGEIRRDFLKIEQIAGGEVFKLKFPSVRGRIEWNPGRGYTGIDKTEVLTSLMREYFNGLYITEPQRIPIKANVNDKFILSILKDIELHINFNGTHGKRNLEFVFDKVNCAKTSSFYTTYLHRGGSGGGTFEQVNPGQDSLLTTIYKIGNGGPVNEDFFKKELVPMFFKGMSQDVNTFITSALGGGEEGRKKLVKQIYDYIKPGSIEAFIEQRANRIITPEDNRELNNDYNDLNRKRENMSIGIKKQTDPLNQQVQRIDGQISRINTVNIPKEEENSKKNTIIAKALVKRTIEVHYEVIRRTYEGLFINESLEEMRETMTNVLQKGTDTAIVPNFYSKCTNYYTNPLLEPLFEPKTSTINKDKEKFNIIHQILVKNKTNTTETPTKEEIIENLQKKIVYCVCLLINNTYTDTNGTFNQNPPKIPYIDLTEGFTELTRFKKRNSKMIQGEMIDDVKNLVFKRYTHEKGERTSNNNNQLIDDKLQKIIASISGYSYDDFTKATLHFSIFENIHNYLLYCYRMSCYAKEGEHYEISGETKTYYGNGNKSIAQSKIKEINDKFVSFKKMNDDCKKQITRVRLKSLIQLAEDYLKSIHVMNATSIIGTIDFADEISKYNLKYNKCSISQFNFDYKLDSDQEKRFLYSSEYDYLQNFRNYDKNKFGVHLYIPNHEFIFHNLWPSYILPSILKLEENKDVYTGLLLNKMSGLTHENKMLGFINEEGQPNVKFFKKLNGEEIKFSKFEVTFKKNDKKKIQIIFAHTDDSDVTTEETLEIDLTQPIQSQLTSKSDIKMKLQKALKIEDEQILKHKITNIQIQRKKISDEITSKQEEFVKFKEKLAEAKAQTPPPPPPPPRPSPPPLSPQPSSFGQRNQDSERLEERRAKEEEAEREEQQRKKMVFSPEVPPPSPPSPPSPRQKQTTDFIPTPETLARVKAIKAASRSPNVSEPKSQYQQPQVPQQPKETVNTVKMLYDGQNPFQTMDRRGTSRSIGTRQGIVRGPQPDPPSAAHGAKSYERSNLYNTPQRSLAGQPFNPTTAFTGLKTIHKQGKDWRGSKQLKTLKEKGYDVKEEVNKLNTNEMILRLIPPRSGGSKTRKKLKLKLKLMPAKKIERKYKQSLKNKVKLNHSQVNRSKLSNEVANNKTKKHLRLKLIKKKKNVRKYKQSLKNKK